MKETFAFQITVLYRKFLSYTTEELKKLGLCFGQMPLIRYVGKHPACTQAELTRNLRLDWGYSQRSIAKLAENGFMNKEAGKVKSGNCLTLTEKGAKAFEVCHEVFDTWDSLQLNKLTSDERENLFLLLHKMTAEGKESE